MRVGIVYLSYACVPLLPEVVSAWKKLTYPKDKLSVYFVDNASQDGALPLMRRLLDEDVGHELPRVKIIANETNLGFAAGNNVGIRQAIADGAEFVYLHNDDLRLDPRAIDEVVAKMADPTVGAVQSLVCYWDDEGKVNTSGNMIHFLGFGFARDNGRRRFEITVKDGEEIAYASGAAVLMRASALEEVGSLEEHYWMYHEDLELGWRFRLAGWKSVIATSSLAFHRYEFKRSIKKFFWMERNRWLVMLSLLKIPSLVLLVPWMVLLEVAAMPIRIRGGWAGEIKNVYLYLLRPTTWKHIRGKRKQIALIRKTSDRDVMRLWTGKVEHQETDSPFVRLLNPLLAGLWRVVYFWVRW
ncbi:glycosyltransferase family 2 protein [Candidatus Uhrbacteria bacterium]|nr:glycosyltransferase family 2 protein [Candidatus Uhrbacteria bacterium]